MTARIYVGTYAKYSAGLVAGGVGAPPAYHYPRRA